MKQACAQGLAALIALLGGCIGQAVARDITYQPISPSFGGDPLNGSFVFGVASANNLRHWESLRTTRLPLER